MTRKLAFRPSVSSLTFLVVIFYLATSVVDAPLRFYLGQIGLAPAIYLRDLAITTLLVLEILLAFRERRWNAVMLLCMAILAFHVGIGLISLGNPLQVLFGLKLFMPMLFGIMAARRLVDGDSMVSFQRACLLLWLVALSGVVLEFLVGEYPWKGFESEVGGVSIVGNRDWTTGGIIRLAGFGRASYDTALILLFTASFVVFNFRFPIRILILAATLLGVALTTTKAAIAGTAVSLLVVCLWSLKLVGRRWAALLLVAASAAAMVIVPIILNPTLIHIDSTDHVQRILFNSILDRIENTWPGAIQLLLQAQVPALGRGVGGVGTAQLYFESALYSPADNFFIYLLVTAGVFSLLYVALMLVPAIRAVGRSGNGWRRVGLITLNVFLIGWTTNYVESSAAMLFLGLAVSGCLDGEECRRQDVPIPDGRGSRFS